MCARIGYPSAPLANPKGATVAALVASPPSHAYVPRESLARHVRELCGVVGPLAVSQLCQMGMAVIDTVLLGSLGERALAAGGLGSAIFFTTNIMLQGVLASVSVLVAQARGAGQSDRIPAIYWTGLLLALLLMLPDFAWISAAEPFLRAIGEPPEIAHDVGVYLGVLRWGIPGAVLGLGLMRALLTAIGDVRVLLMMAPILLVGDGLLNYGLIHGVGPLPRLGYLGSATAGVIALWTGALILLAHVHLRRRLRGLVRPCLPHLAYLREQLAIGLPIGATVAVETFLFLFTGLLMGMLGPAALAAHQIAMNVTSLVFMVPLAIAQAANARVGFWVGAGARHEARRAGFVALGMSIGFMLAVALTLVLAPRMIAGQIGRAHV